MVTKGQWKDSVLLELPGSFTVVDMGVQAGWNHTGTHTLTARMCLRTRTHTHPRIAACRLPDWDAILHFCRMSPLGETGKRVPGPGVFLAGEGVCGGEQRGANARLFYCLGASSAPLFVVRRWSSAQAHHFGPLPRPPSPPLLIRETSRSQKFLSDF